MTDPSAALKAASASARAWLFDQALPLWAERGVNPVGGFFDALDFDGSPADAPMRARVQARQVYVFAEAGRLGWGGPWREAVEHGARFMLERAHRADGLVAASFTPDGRPVDGAPVLYDQSFVLFGYAHAFDALRDEALRSRARSLIATLQSRYAAPSGNFRELDPAETRLLANPHMHMLEACQTWTPLDPDGPWAEIAARIVDLALTRLIDPQSHAVREVFGPDWRPEGDVTEPGHGCEWAWLLARAGAPSEMVVSMAERSEASGLDAARGVLVDEVSTSGEVLSPTARLWPQTERLKAALAAQRLTGDAVWTARAASALKGLFAYIDPAPAGLWFDVLEPDGRLRTEPAKASSLYHIVCALFELSAATAP